MKVKFIIPILGALLFGIASCQSIDSALKEGDFESAEKIAASSKENEKAGNYVLLGDAALKKKNYKAAVKYFDLAGDGRRLIDIVGKLPSGNQSLTLTCYERASALLKASAPADAAAIAKKGAALTLQWAGKDEAAQSMLAGAGVPPQEIYEFLGDYYLRHKEQTPHLASGMYDLKRAQSYFKATGNTEKLKMVDAAYYDIGMNEKNEQAALAAYAAVGLDEKAAFIRVGRAYEKGMNKLETAIGWYKRSGEADVFKKGLDSLVTMYLNYNKPENAEEFLAGIEVPRASYVKELGKGWEKKGEYRKALELYESCGRMDLATYAYKGLANQSRSARDFANVVAYQTKAGIADKDMRSDLEKAAQDLYDKKEYEQAAAFYARAENRYSARSAYAKAGGAALEKKDYDKAIDCYRKGEAGDWSLDHAYKGKAGDLVEKGDAKGARAFLAAQKDDAYALKTLYDIMVDKDSWDDARKYLVESGTAEQEAWNKVAESAKNKGAEREAMTFYGKAGNAEKKSEVARDAAFNLLDKKEYAKAADFLIRDGKTEKKAYAELAERELKKSEHDSALELLAKAGVPRSEARVTVAEAASKRGFHEKAADLYEKAGMKEKAKAEISTLVEKLLSNRKWDEANAALLKTGLSAAQIRARLLSAALKGMDLEKAEALYIESGLSPKVAAFKVGEEAEKANFFERAVGYYKKAGDEEKAKALAGKAAEETLYKGDPVAAISLFKTAGDEEGQALARKVLEASNKFQKQSGIPSLTGQVLVDMAAATEKEIGKKATLAAIMAGSLSLLSQGVSLYTNSTGSSYAMQQINKLTAQSRLLQALYQQVGAKK